MYIYIYVHLYVYLYICTVQHINVYMYIYSLGNVRTILGSFTREKGSLKGCEVPFRSTEGRLGVGIIYTYRVDCNMTWYSMVSYSPPTLGWRVGELGGLAGTERGYPEPFGLLEPPAQNPGCCCVVG